MPDAPSSVPFESFPEYPFEDFAQDFDAISTEVNETSECDHASAMLVLRSHMQKTYADPAQRTRRGAVVGMCFSFISNHVEDKAFRRFVVQGVRGSLYSENFFRAIYEVVGGFSLDPTRPQPSVQAVRRCAALHAPKERFSLKRLFGLRRY